MTKEELYSYIEDPRKLNKESLPQLEQLVDDYPFSGPLVFLYLCNLAYTQDIRYPSELRRLAIRLPDRSLLYQLIEHQLPYTLIKEEAPTSDHFALLEKFLDEYEEPTDALAGVDHSDTQLAESDLDYFSSLYNEEEGEAESIESNTTEKLASTKEKEKQPINSEATAVANTQSKDSSEQDALNNEDWEETRFTEILARIFISQRKYAKALTAYQNLSAKNSEKSSYFAVHIRYLQILIENNSTEE